MAAGADTSPVNGDPGCYNFSVEDCDMEPFGPVRKENMDVIRLIYDFSCFLDAGESIAQIVFTTIAPISTAQNYRGWQADYPLGAVASSALPADLYPLLVTRTAITNDNKSVEIRLSAGTPDLMYLMSFAVLAGASGRRKQVDTLVAIDPPLNPALVDLGTPPDDIYVKKAGDQMSGPLEIDAGGTALLVPNGGSSLALVTVTGNGAPALNVPNGGTTLASLHVNGAVTAGGNISTTGSVIGAEVDCNTLRVDVVENTNNITVTNLATINGGGTALSVPNGNIVTGNTITALQAHIGSAAQLTVDTIGNLNTLGYIDGSSVICNTLRVDVSATIPNLILSGNLTAHSVSVGALTIDSSGNITTTGQIFSTGASGLLDAATIACNTLRADISITTQDLHVNGNITSTSFNSIGNANVNGDTTISGILLVHGASSSGTAIFADAGNIVSSGAIIGASAQFSGALSAGSMTLPAGGSINANGNIFCNGNLTTNSQLTANGAIINGLMTVNQTLTCTSSISVPGGAIACNGNISSNANITANGNVTSNSGLFGNTATITGALIVNGGGNSIMTTAGNIQSAGEGFKPGGGVWADSSDRRLKMDIEQYATGLDAVEQLQPVSYKFNGRGGTLNDGRTHVGLVANDVLEIMPEMVGKRRGKVNVDDEDEDDILTMNATALIYALVNSVKELSARVKELEAR